MATRKKAKKESKARSKRSPKTKTERVRKLTGMQEKFCQLYTTHWNATRAAKEAGYSEKNAGVLGYQTLQIPLVKDRISELTEHTLKELGVSRERVLKEVCALAFVKMSDVAQIIDGEVHLLDFDEMTDEAAAALKSISYTKSSSSSAEGYSSSRSISFGLHDKRGSLEFLGKHLQILTENHKHSGRVTMTLEDLVAGANEESE